MGKCYIHQINRYILQISLAYGTRYLMRGKHLVSIQLYKLYFPFGLDISRGIVAIVLGKYN